VLLRTSGWEIKKHKDQTSEETAAYLISTVPVPQPPSPDSSPPRSANTPAAGTGAVRHSSPATGLLLPRPAWEAGAAAEAFSEHEPAAHVADLGPGTAPCQWPAVIALLPNGCISGIM